MSYKFELLGRDFKVKPTRPFVKKVPMEMTFLDYENRMFSYKNGEFTFICNVMTIQRKTYKSTGIGFSPYTFEEYKGYWLNEDDI